MLWVKGELLTDIDAPGIDPTGQLEKAAQQRLFDRREWFRRVARHSGFLPLVGRAASEGSLCWLFLQRESGSAVVSLANPWSFAFRPVFSGSPDGLRQRAMLIAISKRLRKARPHIASVSLSPVPESDGTAGQLRAALSTAGWITSVRQISAIWSSQVQGRSFAEYCESRPAAFRESIKHDTDMHPFDTLILSDFNEEFWSHLEALLGQHWLTDESPESFEKQLAVAEGVDGRLRLGLCRVNGAVVAAQFWTIDNGAALIHATAKLEGDAATSGAHALTKAMFCQAIDFDRVQTIETVSRYDGQMSAWLDDCAPLMRIDAFNPSSLAGLWGAAKTRLSGLFGH